LGRARPVEHGIVLDPHLAARRLDLGSERDRSTAITAEESVT
jgi:hypothetical protein